MTDFYFAKGGPCIPECLPICDGCKSKDRSQHLPYPTRVAGEFDRGDFVLSNLLNPRQVEAQRLALLCKPAAADDFISMVVIPEIHTLYDLVLQVETTQTTYVPTVTEMANNMAGFTADVEARIMGPNGTQTGSVTLTGLDGVDLAVDGVIRSPVSPTTLGHFVPKGSWVEIGLKLLTMSSRTPAVTLDNISGGIYLSARVADYQAVVHV